MEIGVKFKIMWVELLTFDNITDLELCLKSQQADKSKWKFHLSYQPNRKWTGEQNKQHP